MKIIRTETTTRERDYADDTAPATMFKMNESNGVDTITLYGRLPDGSTRMIEYRKVEEEK